MRSVLRLKVVAVALGVSIAGLAGLAAAIHWAATRQMEKMVWADLTARVELMVSLVRRYHNTNEIYRAQEEARLKRKLATLAQAYLQLCEQAYKLVEEGKLTEQEAKSWVETILLGQKIGDTGYPFVLDISGAPQRVILAVHPKIKGRNVANVEFIPKMVRQRNGYMEYFWANPGEPVPRLKAVYMAYFPPWHWIICPSAYKSEFPFYAEGKQFYSQAWAALEKEILAIRVGRSGYGLIMDTTGQIVVAPAGHEEEIKALAEHYQSLAEHKGTMQLPVGTTELMVAWEGFSELGWVVCVVAHREQVLGAPVGRIRTWTILAVGVAVGAITIVLIVLMGRALGRPLSRLGELAGRVAAGEIDPEEIDIGPQEELQLVAGGLKELAIRLREAMATVASEKERYRNLFNYAPEPGYLVSLGGFIIDINQAAERLLKTTRQEAHGKHFGCYTFPEEVDRLRQLSKQAYKSGQPLAGVEITVVDTQGQAHQLVGFFAPVKDKEGKVSGFYGLMRDLSEERRLQRQLVQMQKMEVVGTLAGGISHDFNNLLMGIIGCCSLLQKTTKLQPTQQRYVGIIHETATRASELAHRLLSFSRGGPSRREVFNLNDVVREVVALLERTFPPSITISCNLSPALPVINADRGQIHQALLNLCINSRDAMPSGGTLEIITRHRRLSKTLKALNSQPLGPEVVEIIVSDTGVGMDPETLERACDPFFSTKPEGQGTGLGLAMVYYIVKEHGGLLEITSRSGRGTQVCITLPAGSTAAVQPGGEEKGQAAMDGRGKCVLVVDDEPLVAQITCEMLEGVGFKTFCAADGAEAMAIINDHSRELAAVVMDVLMPGAPGTEVAREIKERYSHIKVILTTGKPDASTREAARSCGADAFLPKPFKFDELLEVLSRMLD